MVRRRAQAEGSEGIKWLWAYSPVHLRSEHILEEFDDVTLPRYEE